MFYNIIKNLGMDWFIFRSYYELKRKSGILKYKFKAEDINEVEIKNISYFDSEKELIDNWSIKTTFILDNLDLVKSRLTLVDFLSTKDKDEILNTADKAIKGKIKMFENWYADYGNPINWHYNPVSKEYSPKNEHWIDIEELGDDFGDVKYIWEVSRFSQTFYFIRAYTLTNDEKYVKAFWKQVETWMDNNPAEMGVNWKCGQEITFRTIAWIFGLYSFKDSKHSTDERIIKLFKYIYYNVRHVEKNFEFALKAVKNNHAVSEAAGMFTAGVLFPFFKDAERWRKKGKRYLEELVDRQIYADGTYKQYSTNYNRLVLEVYSFALRLAELNDIEFKEETKNKLLKSVNYLYQIQDNTTGRVPNFGSNDGALLFSLSNSDYLDYKPQLNLLYYILTKKKLYKIGKHEEELFWFYDINVLNSEVSKINKKSMEFNIGGYYLLRNKDSHAMIRCGDFQDRPAHSDLLHLDLWWKGNNILTDAGTYSYNPEEKFQNYFIQTSSHNTVTVNNKNQMKKGPRFLWFDWTKSTKKEFVINNKFKYFEGEHYGYNSITHRRAVYNKNDIYIIVDDIFGDNNNLFNLKQNWLIGNFVTKIENNKVEIQTDQGNYILQNFNNNAELNFFKGNKNKPAGWCSLYYGKKEAVAQIYYELETDLPFRYITIAYPEEINFIEKTINNRRINFTYKNNEIDLSLNSIKKTPVIVGGGDNN